jgi:acyl transferase domain-containing protein/acyl carrier protein
MDFVGPSMTVQAGCSSSLLAIHLSVQSLLLQECDVAVAGGVSISYPINSGYIYQEGSITSKDGRICSFDENATGTVRGDGCGVVILKRLDDALKDEDNILSIIKGTATTNDGKNKIGFTAPGLQQQINVISEAIISSECNLNDIDFVEAHGTGTKIGDPIEIRAISEVFKNKEAKIAITSVKPHIGHLDVASGIASFIKTCISLKNNIIPHTLNFKNINPMIKPFCEKIEILKNIKHIPYAEKRVITAGVTSLGMGGTNVHVILQSANQNIDKKIGIRRRKFNAEEFVIYPSAIKEIYDKDTVHKENKTECYEEAINKAWRIILGKDNIKLTDNFFDLGGNSFSAIQCITFLNDKIAFKLDVIDFFSNPTLGGFIKYVKDRING